MERFIDHLPGFFHEADALDTETKALENKTEEDVRELRRRLLARRGHPELIERKETAQTAAEQAAREHLSELARQAYTGAFGSGMLVVTTKGFRDTAEYQLGRVLPITMDRGDYNYRYLRRDLETRSVDHDQIVTVDNPGSFHYGTHQPERRFLEVSVDVTAPEEYEQFYQELKHKGWNLEQLKVLFPPDFTPSLEVGEILPGGGCDHHSGMITGYKVVLPTGRLAIIGEYSGERRSDGFSLWGVTSDMGWDPSWSAKHASLENSEELAEASTEELAFLQGWEYQGQRPFAPELPTLRALAALPAVGETNE